MRLPQMNIPDLTRKESVPIINNIIKRIVYAINTIEFGEPASGNENILCKFVTLACTAADEVVSASHTLGTTPHSTICTWEDKPGIWYKPTDATSADTSDTIYVLCNTANTSAVLMVF